MAGKRHKQKGDRVERRIVALHKMAGVVAERIPLSGAAGGSFSGDVRIDTDVNNGGCLLGEVKARKGATGWKTIKGWLGNNDVLFLVEDCCEPLVVLTWASYQAVLQGMAERITKGDDDGPVQVPETL